MGYLETFNNSIEYNEEIGDNGFSIGPSVATYEENNKTKVKYVKRPSYKLTYDKSATKLFKNGYNIKRVWDESGILFENNNPLTNIEMVVNETDIEFNDAGTDFKYVNPNIMLNPPYYETMEISLDNDNILETDSFGILLYDGSEYGVMGGLITQLRFEEGFGLIDGKMILPNGVTSETSETSAISFSFYIQRDNKILKTIIKFIGIDGRVEIEAERDADGVPVLPKNTYMDYAIIESDVALDDFNDGLYLRVSSPDGEGGYQISSINQLKQSQSSGGNVQVFENKKVTLPVNQSIGDYNYNICFCHITWKNNEPDTEVIDYTLITEVTAKVYVRANAGSLTKTSDTDFTIKYEPYNRFQGVSLNDTNVSNIYDSLKNVTQLTYPLFSYCKFLTKLVIPNTVTTVDINGLLFCNCDKLEYVELPGSITNIEKLKFEDLPSLKTIVCYAQVTQPHVFFVDNVAEGGVIKVPFGSDTSCWDVFVKTLNWTIEYI